VQEASSFADENAGLTAAGGGGRVVHCRLADCSWPNGKVVALVGGDAVGAEPEVLYAGGRSVISGMRALAADELAEDELAADGIDEFAADGTFADGVRVDAGGLLID
jgi:hypothetical protein